MRARLLLGLATVLLLVSAAHPVAASVTIPSASHVVVVVMENKAYDMVRTQPWTAGLIASGGVCTSSYGVTHPSQPNYIALWAANLLGVTNNNCPAPGYPLTAENLGHACQAAGLTWRSYSENLPSAGASGCSYEGSASSGLYTRKHDPWTQFSNLNHLNERPYSDLALDIAGGTLPNLAFIIPNNCHNTHNSGTPGCTVPDGDAWLAANMPAIQNAIAPNGVLILTWDEDDNFAGNHILTVFAGGTVVPGSVCSRTVTHYTIVRTITDLLGLPAFGSALNETPVDGIWAAPVSTIRKSWQSVKQIYR